MKESLIEKAENTVELLKQKGLTVATAESCTGGLVSAYITEIAGASSVFEAGIVSYSNRIKNKVLNVNSDTLKSFGAVSKQTATEMAENVKAISNADIGVSVTGVAGPGADEGHLPGYIFVGISYKQTSKAVLLDFKPLSRSQARETAVEKVFQMIASAIEGD